MALKTEHRQQRYRNEDSITIDHKIISIANVIGQNPHRETPTTLPMDPALQ